MRQQSKESIVILFVSAALALNYPVLHLFDRAWALLGIPILYLYLYLLWFLIIILLIIVVERSELREPGESAPVAEPALHSEMTPKADRADPMEWP